MRCLKNFYTGNSVLTNEYIKFVNRKREIREQWCEDNPNETWLPNILINESSKYGDVKPVNKVECTSRDRLVKWKLMFHRYLNLGCGHQGKVCRQPACSYIWNGILATYAASLAENHDEQVAMADAMDQFAACYDRDHYYSWAKTAEFYECQPLLFFIEEVVRSDCVSTCCREHIQKTLEWKDKTLEKTIRKRKGKAEDVDDVYTNISRKQHDGINRQRGVPLVTEVDRLSIPLSKMPWIKGTPMEDFKEPDWYLSYIALLRFRYSVELNYSLKDTETRIYDTITMGVMTEAETKECIHQLVSDLDKWEEEENGGKKQKEIKNTSYSNRASGWTTITSNSGSNTGRWTSEEHNLFLQGVELHGKCSDMIVSTKIAATIKSRTYTQVYGHANIYYRTLKKKAAKNLNATERRRVAILDDSEDDTSNTIANTGDDDDSDDDEFIKVNSKAHKRRRCAILDDSEDDTPY